MSEQTHIAWCDSTINFWSGCTKVSPGCKNCYAEALSNRGMGNIGKWGKGAPRQLHESAFKLAHKLNRNPLVCDTCGEQFKQLTGRQKLCEPVLGDPCQNCNFGHYRSRRIFSLSLGDWLDPEAPIEWLARMLDTIRQCPDVTWQLLTKRPENFVSRLHKVFCEALMGSDFARFVREWFDEGNPPTNVWIGASVENQEAADRRISELLQIPARVRFLSCEPLLGPVNLHQFLCRHASPSHPGQKFCPLCDGPTDARWIIAGGESGRNARPCNLEWVGSIVSQCKAAGVACFVKQLGGNAVMRESGTYVSEFSDAVAEAMAKAPIIPVPFGHPKGGDPAEWPIALRVREFPI